MTSPLGKVLEILIYSVIINSLIHEFLSNFKPNNLMNPPPPPRGRRLTHGTRLMVLVGGEWMEGGSLFALIEAFINSLCPSTFDSK